MTEQEQIKAIAEGTGWVQKKTWFSHTDVRIWWQKKGEHLREHAPDYLNDLNAMHEAENELGKTDSNQRLDFIIILGQVLDRKKSPTQDHNFDIVHATASQRAESFLKTIKKWTP